MSEQEVAGSDIYLQPTVLFERGLKYMVCAKSGHGKTSLLNFIYGNSLQFDGVIDYHEPVKDPFVLRRDRLSYLFQDLCLFPQLTAMENVQLKNRLTNHKTDAEIEAMLDTLLPPEKKHQPVQTLSLGQRQRVAAVRALCQPFHFLMLDEPFSHIDHQNATTVASLVMSEVEAQGAGLIVTALDYSDLFPFEKTFNL
ncbi:MAG: ATP-binding cassette domain-containing protein [Bacteroidales bacterium]|nr:ATP-binding cassette domain-containing protein [Bacteroidales bacterium]